MKKFIKLLCSLHRDEKGQTLLFSVMALLVLAGMFMLVIDIGQMVVNRIYMQNVADAAALNGAKAQAQMLNFAVYINRLQYAAMRQHARAISLARSCCRCCVVRCRKTKTGRSCRCVKRCCWGCRGSGAVDRNATRLQAAANAIIPLLWPIAVVKPGIYQMGRGVRAGRSNLDRGAGIPLLNDMSIRIHTTSLWSGWRPCRKCPVRYIRYWNSFLRKTGDRITEKSHYAARLAGDDAWGGELIKINEFPSMYTTASARPYHETRGARHTTGIRLRPYMMIPRFRAALIKTDTYLH